MEQELIYHERFRPGYHFSPPHGWMNDPNGLVYFHGQYHLFYQYNPDHIYWSDPHWGHAVSSDMVHWRNLPIALFPDDLGTIFSGTIVADLANTSGLFSSSGGLVALFTHHAASGEEYQSLAFSDDDGLTWIKYEGNPVLRGLGGEEWKDFRDPKVLRFQDSWLMITGGGRFRFFTSKDLIHWTFLSDLSVFEEFPDLFCLEGQWVLNVNGFYYYLGILNARGFLPAQDAVGVDFANSWQACYVWDNLPDDRKVWIAWMRDSAKGPTYSWRCNMSVPRELSLRKTDFGFRILQNPICELSSLHELLFEARDCRVEDIDLSWIKDKRLDIIIEAELTDDLPFVVECFASGESCAEVGYRPDEGMVFLDTRKASSPEFSEYSTMFSGKMSTPGNGECILSRLYSQYHPIRSDLSLRILLDESTIEAFFDGGAACATANVYPPENGDGLKIYGMNHRIRHIQIYHMKSIW